MKKQTYDKLLARPATLFARMIFGDRPITAVEIGVLGGENAENIVSFLNVKRLYLIDPYLVYPDAEGKPNRYVPAQKQKAYNRMRRFAKKVTWVYAKSDDAVNQIPDNIDYIYIDGNHDYAFIKNDVENYYRKVRQGGILSGHDFFDDVAKAVTEFVELNNMKLYTMMDDWWIVVNGIRKNEQVDKREN
jgi:hypothetical protein